ncbi:MAG: YerC/YecD family TrpR-related protein [Candidatus Levyibacteriota bacterium]
MAQVSKRQLNKQVEEKILDLFWTSLSMLSTKDKISSFLDDLLTPTEKLMLSKRLAIAFMLLKKDNYPTINDRLKVSDPTIWNVKTNLHHRGKGYKMVIEEIMKKERWEKFWQDLDHLLEQAIPPRPGTNWKKVRRKQWEKRRKQQKSF